MTRSAARYIGVDIGASKTAFVVSDGARVIERSSMPTGGADEKADIFERIAAQLNACLSRHKSIRGIGIGVPGPVDSERGIALNAVNLGWQGVDLRSEILERLARPLPIHVDNDVNVGALGEWLYGAAQGIDDFVYIAIGTGIGGAAIVGGQLHRGVNHAEMELGHVSLDPIHGRLCDCGLRGCLEMSISGKGLLAIAKERLAECAESVLLADSLTPAAILKAAEIGDPLARSVMDEAATALGIGCAWCLALFNPRTIALGGGLAHAAWHLLEARTIETIQQRCLHSSVAAADIRLSHHSDAALGAVALARLSERKERTT